MRRWIGMGLVLGVIVAMVAGGVYLYSQPRDRPCTLVGCTNAVSFDLTAVDPATLAATSSVTFCANQVCVTEPVVAGSSQIMTTLKKRAVDSATLSLTGVAGEELLHLELRRPAEAQELQPNGPECGPTCWFLRLTTDGHALAPKEEAGAQPTTTASR